jgi:acetoin utilization deacetylase AcuC-like enzyme
MSVGYAYDPVYLKHDTGNHVENASRLIAIMKCLEESRLKERLEYIRPRAATLDELTLVHSPTLVGLIQVTAKKGGGWLDPDTVMSSGSYEAALFAAGGMIETLNWVMDGGGSAFALVRPPGHHATTDRAMGFCLFNSIAIATKYALMKYGLERIAIIDFDVHHGNGTQDVFYGDSEVLYVSVHESPLYPGSGSIEETGRGEGKGATINIPLPAGSGDTEYMEVFEQVIAPAVSRFKPQLIMVSAGYDPHWSESLAMMEVSVMGFARMVGVVKRLAEELSGGRMVFTLEGGYPLISLAASVKATFDVLLGSEDIEDPLGPPQAGFKMRGFQPPDISSLLEKIKKFHRLS